jgi:hypothetical protein
VSRTRTLQLLLGLAIPLSLVHYTDNYLAFEQYPQGRLFGRPLTPDAIWIGWLLFTAAGVLGYLLYRRDRPLAASAALAVFSVGGLISLGHYGEPGMGRLAVWRHVAVWVDVLLGAAVLAFAVWTALRPRRPVSG